MRTQFFLLLLLIFADTGFGQSLVETGKVWNNVIRDYWNYDHLYTETLQFTDDTLIGAYTYKKVERSVDSLQQEWNPYGFIREDAGKRVWYSPTASGPEYLFYDFDLQSGDTITVNGIFTTSGNLNISPMTYHVMATDSILIGDTLRRRLHLATPEDTSWTVEFWIEGMGNMGGLLHNRHLYVGCDFHELLCFTENDLLQYQNPGYASCYIVTALSPDAGFPDAIRLYPNPAGDQVTIDASAGVFTQYIITDLAGQPIIVGKLPATMTVDIENLPPGIYLVRLEGEQSGRRETLKLMKE